MPTFLYSPGVRVLIETTKAGIIDVTPDLAGGSLSLEESTLSMLRLRITNHKRMYDGAFTPNDRVSVQMKRISWVQVFSGYLTRVPWFSVYPRSVNLTAHCTLKRLRYRFWDPGAQASFDLLNKQGTGEDAAKTPDGGLDAKVIAILTEVAQWPQEAIHMGRIPGNWLGRVQAIQKQLSDRLQVDAALLGVGTHVYGYSPASAGSVSVTPAGPGTGVLPATSGKATYFGTEARGAMALTGETTANPFDQFYCAMRWPYQTDSGGKGAVKFHPVPGVDVTAAKNWWKQQRILVINPANNRAVVLRPADWGPATWTGGAIDMSRYALETVLGIPGRGDVQIRFAPPNTPPGAASPSLASSQAAAAVVPPAGVVPTPAPSATPTTPTGAPWQSIDSYLASKGIRFGAPTPGQTTTGTHKTGSYHYRGQGRDYGSATSDLLAIWNALLPFAQGPNRILDELFYDPQGGWDNGISIGPIGGHATHVHAALRDGAYMPVDPNAPPPAGVPGTPGAGGLGGPAPLSMFNTWQWQGSPSDMSQLLAGPRALMNDEPLLPTVQMLVEASQRKFMAGPNGDFIAWFPDYFGIYGGLGKMQIADIELADDGFTVDWDDSQLVTHQFVTGAPTGWNGPQQAIDIYQMFQTMGIASIEFPEIMESLFNINTGDPLSSTFGDANAVLQRFSARINHRTMGAINQGDAEFWWALHLFQFNWAQQFNASINLTFMPELYPGMLIQLPSLGFQAYVESVEHSFDFEAESGFRTNIRIVAPSNMGEGNKGLFGLPKPDSREAADTTRPAPTGRGTLTRPI